MKVQQISIFVDRLASTQANADVHLFVRLFLIVGSKRLLNGNSTLDCISYGGKGNHKPVTGVLDFTTIVLPQSVSCQRIVDTEQMHGFLVSKPRGCRRRVLQVGKHDGTKRGVNGCVISTLALPRNSARTPGSMSGPHLEIFHPGSRSSTAACRLLSTDPIVICCISSSVNRESAAGPGSQHCSIWLGLGSCTGMIMTSFPLRSFSIRPPDRTTACRTNFSETSTSAGNV